MRGMVSRPIFPIHSLIEPTRGAPPPVHPDGLPVPVLGDEVRDLRGRVLRDLRISVTDRCNFRCSYCMPKEVFASNHRFLPRPALLTFEEIERVARVFVGLGVQKIRLTGGEPLLRKGLPDLVHRLAQIRTPQGEALDLTLTTNGSALRALAQDLQQAGLRRITVSLDALDDAVFRRMNDVDFPVAQVLEGIDEALRVGLDPLKINMVVKRGANDHEALPLARFVRDRYGDRVRLRFIEFMDVGQTNGWRMNDVVPSAELQQRLAQAFPMDPLAPASSGETAERWRYRDGRGEVGFISSVTRAFCGACNRARLSTEGQLYACLFGSAGHDLRRMLREPTPSGQPFSDAQLAQAVGGWWQARGDHYSELRSQATADLPSRGSRVEMSYIGG